MCVESDTMVTLESSYESQVIAYKPVSDWLEMLPLDSTGLNM